MFDQHLFGSVCLLLGGFVIGIVTWQIIHRRHVAGFTLVEIPKDLPVDWPKGWSGGDGPFLDCGSEGRFAYTLHTPSHPAAVHVANFRDIVNRWDKLWPLIRGTVADTLHCPHAIRCPGAVLDIYLPDGRIGRSVKWHVSLIFYDKPHSWNVLFIGWQLDPSKPGYID